MLPLVDKTSAG